MRDIFKKFFAKKTSSLKPENSTIDDEGLMVPPWIKYPNLYFGSIGWRMGAGENYWYDFKNNLNLSSEHIRLKTIDKYPEPIEWKGYYAKVAK